MWKNKEGNKKMNKKSEFYTLNGYKAINKMPITEAMEDYIEMIYRNKDTPIRIKDLSIFLNVKPPSVSKMMNKLKQLEFVSFEKYGLVYLTEKGKKIGEYLLWRHNTLTKFFKILNKENYKLETVEKIEHFLDTTTILNLEKLTNNLQKHTK